MGSLLLLLVTFALEAAVLGDLGEHLLSQLVQADLGSLCYRHLDLRVCLDVHVHQAEWLWDTLSVVKQKEVLILCL